MKGFTLVYSDSVSKYLEKIPKDRQVQILRKLDLLPIDPKLLDIVRMGGRENTYRVRVSSYRIILVVDFTNKIIKVERVGTKQEMEKYY